MISEPINGQFDGVKQFLYTVRTQIIGPHTTTLKLPLLVKLGSFVFLFDLRRGPGGSVFALCSPPYPTEGISNSYSLGPIIRALTVLYLILWVCDDHCLISCNFQIPICLYHIVLLIVLLGMSSSFARRLLLYVGVQVELSYASRGYEKNVADLTGAIRTSAMYDAVSSKR